jgi:hypothetical protein
MAIPNPQKYLKTDPLSTAEKEARRQLMVRQLLAKH